MAHAQDLVRFISDLRNRLERLIQDIVSLPAATNADDQMVIIWRLLLLALTEDVTGSIIALGKLEDENHARALRMLDRSIFEYGLRLEYYVFFPKDAVAHGSNLKAWWGVLIAASAPYMDVASLTKEERHQLDAAIADAGEIQFPQIQAMLNRCLKENGYKSGERKRRSRWILSHYYQLGSALVHGSQGAFIDFFAKNPATDEFSYTPKSIRYTVYDSLFNTALNLIGAIGSEEKHRKTDLAVDYYYREFELLTGRWEYVAATGRGRQRYEGVAL